ncbi:FAD-dependent oxidoreductase [Rhodococcus sp. NPDC058639]|uniref:FAD-dependent oxidoreductase n=1 Tax=Rhodococcus sp. NPDC058639 TaxID=3346570 RepID=UPI0036550966
MSRANSRVDAVVIGGGVIGSSAAWRLAARGRSVVLLEQFEQGHRRGASHGSSRIYRQAYDGEFYTAFAASALPLWRQLQDATGHELLTLTGAVDHGSPATVLSRARVLDALRIDAEVLEPAAAEKRWPGIRFDTTVVHHPGAGRLHADRAVVALHRAAALEGADVRFCATVRELRRVAGCVEVITDSDVVRTGHVVIAAGAWSSRLLSEGGIAPVPDLPRLRTTQEQPAHFAPLAPDDWPSFVHHPGAGLVTEGIYGLGSDDGIKIGEHGTGPEVDPRTRTFAPDPDGVRRLVEYAETWLPGVDPGTVVADTCLYTTTPDSNFVIDRIGDVTVAAGFSGHGFKFAPAVGELVTGLVDGTAVSPDVFRVGARVGVVAR